MFYFVSLPLAVTVVMRLRSYCFQILLSQIAMQTVTPSPEFIQGCVGSFSSVNGWDLPSGLSGHTLLTHTESDTHQHPQTLTSCSTNLYLCLESLHPRSRIQQRVGLVLADARSKRHVSLCIILNFCV